MANTKHTCLSVSFFADVGPIEYDYFESIFHNNACLILPHPREKVITKGESCNNQIIRLYTKKLKSIFSPRVFLSSRFCDAIINKDKLNLKYIKFGGKKIDVEDCYINITLFSNGVFKISLKIYSSLDKELVWELSKKSYRLLFDTELDVNENSFIHDYLDTAVSFDSKNKRNLWTLFTAILIYFIETYRNIKKAKGSKRIKISTNEELRANLRSEAIDVYLHFIFPRDFISEFDQEEFHDGKYLIKGDTMFTIDDEPNFENPEIYKYFMIFETTTYILSSLKFLIGTLLKPLEHYETLDDFVKVIDLITRFSSDVRSISYIKLVSENEEVIEAIKYSYKRMYIHNLIEDVNFSLNLLERKLNIISSKANQEAFRIFNALLSISIAINIAQIITDFANMDIWFFTWAAIGMWILLFIGFWTLQSYLERKFYRKTLQTLLG